jgi:glutathione S-transferase
MKTAYRLELVSFDICPYVQRSIITLLHKKAPFELSFIDLAEPPKWFNEISPLGKVPLLRVTRDGSPKTTTLFESAVINEFVDEVTEGQLSLEDPLNKALERAWIEVSGELFGLFYAISVAKDENELQEPRSDLWEILRQVEKNLPGGKTFRGEEFSLVDSAFAPLFMRMDLFPSLRTAQEWAELPKVKAWSNALLDLPEVQDSVIPDFKSKMKAYLMEEGSLLAREF